MSQPLPTGTITFLFTDIEGSTARWERDQAAMAAALGRHDAVSAEAIEGAGGAIFKTTGDGCCATFPDVASAVGAGISLRDGLASETWAESIGPIRVRMAIHSGPAEERAGDYFGPTLNRVARLMAAGHGGQILLSRASCELLGDQRPELKDLGDHRLRDLLRPERIYQLDDLAEEFPQLRAMKSRKHNLPVQLSPFLGRGQELSDIKDLIVEHRLVTLTGPGGTGKTRLALQAAAETLEMFDGAFFVDLAHIRQVDQVVAAIIDSIGLHTYTATNQDELLLNHLASRRDLLLLDNFEHLIEAAPFVGSLVEASSDTHVIVTSRELLRIGGERHYPVPPLSVPSGGDAPTAEILSCESVRLFEERARAARPDFVLEDQNARDAAAVCQRLDGLPLAIELAAARVRLFTASQIRQQIEADIGTLGGGPVDAPERHQTLINTIRWSYDLLDDEERIAFRRFAVFVGGRSLEAVEAVCLFDLDMSAMSVAEALADKSLVRLDQSGDGAVRLHLLSMIYSFARAELEASEELEDLRRRHVDYYVRLVERAESELRGSDQARWTRLLEDERPNLDIALATGFAGGEASDGLRLVAGLRDFWFYQGHLADMSRWVDRALMQLPSDDSGLRSGVLMTAGFRASALQDEASVSYFDEAAELYAEAGDDGREAMALIWGGGDRHGLLADSDAGRQRVEDGLELARRCGADNVVAQGLNMLGEMARADGDFELAREIQQESLDLSTQTGELRRVAMVSNNLGLIAHHLGDDETAHRMVHQALEIALELDFETQVAYSLTTLSEQMVLLGAPEVGGRLIGAADAYYERSGMTSQTADAIDDQRIRVVVSSALGEERYAHEIENGKQLSLEDAAALIGVPSSTVGMPTT